ncbi:hypothetical protein [uncultured Veillonella sp.]|uniref:hypothetical protein n=1 Tax=uncultured Veillonella sp. TaxID=159268 RepID=UPI0025FB39D5|nr:hypothetical protein [uncultured Veillonella sp.]
MMELSNRAIEVLKMWVEEKLENIGQAFPNIEDRQQYYNDVRDELEAAGFIENSKQNIYKVTELGYQYIENQEKNK